MTIEPTQRVSPVIAPERWVRPGKPGDDMPPSIQDAYRQTGFQLGADLRLLEEGMNLQLRLVHDSHPSKFRTHPLAAGLMLWSRAFLAMSDAFTAAVYGSYGSVAPLVRMACECIAAAHQAHTEEQAAFQEWLAGAMKPDEQHRATDITIGQFMAGSTIVGEEDLGAVYRAASELARPHFGVSAALVAAESNQQKLAVTFADQTFHFGWAQLTLGWLLRLGAVQLRLAQTPGAPYNVTTDLAGAVAHWSGRVDLLLNQSDRCRIEEISDGLNRRWLIHNFRRQAGGAPRRLML
ncbi:MAG: hypothetical protein AB7R89_26170 [Dehalococcoidia bacterium]